jgi:hypothetical protein
MEYALRVGIGLIVSSDEPQKPPKPDPPAFANGTYFISCVFINTICAIRGIIHVRECETVLTNKIICPV